MTAQTPVRAPSHPRQPDIAPGSPGVTGHNDNHRQSKPDRHHPTSPKAIPSTSHPLRAAIARRRRVGTRSGRRPIPPPLLPNFHPTFTPLRTPESTENFPIITIPTNTCIKSPSPPRASHTTPPARFPQHHQTPNFYFSPPKRLPQTENCESRAAPSTKAAPDVPLHPQRFPQQHRRKASPQTAAPGRTAPPPPQPSPALAHRSAATPWPPWSQGRDKPSVCHGSVATAGAACGASGSDARLSTETLSSSRAVSDNGGNLLEADSSRKMKPHTHRHTREPTNRHAPHAPNHPDSTPAAPPPETRSPPPPTAAEHRPPSQRPQQRHQHHRQIRDKCRPPRRRALQAQRLEEVPQPVPNRQFRRHNHHRPTHAQQRQHHHRRHRKPNRHHQLRRQLPPAHQRTIHHKRRPPQNVGQQQRQNPTEMRRIAKNRKLRIKGEGPEKPIVSTAGTPRNPRCCRRSVDRGDCRSLQYATRLSQSGALSGGVSSVGRASGVRSRGSRVRVPYITLSLRRAAGSRGFSIHY